MTEQTISPAVFTNENDQSYLPAGISAIGAAFIGPTLKGEAFVPTEVTSYADYEQKFGPANGESYIPYAVKSYLKNASSATITRIVNNGYTHTKMLGIVMSGSSGQKLIGTIHHTTHNPTSDFNTSIIGPLSSSIASAFTISGSDANWIISGSFRSTDSNYVGKSIGTNPNTTNDGYFFTYFESSSNAYITSSATTLISLTTADTQFETYSTAYTPWIQSQLINNSSPLNLFKVHSLSHGEYCNTEFKISIIDVKKSGEIYGTDYGSFGLLVRKIDDTDKNPIILEQWSNLSLDPNSANYICKKIGDKYNVYDSTLKQIIARGDYANSSKYIRIEVSDNVANGGISPILIPYGFAAIEQPIKMSTYNMPVAKMITTQTINNIYSSKAFYGFDFDFTNNDNLQYLKPIMKNSTTGSNAYFNLDNYFVHADADSGAGTSLSGSAAPLSSRRFSVPFQGGFAGSDPAVPKLMGSSIVSTNSMGFNLSSTGSGSAAYKTAIDILSNTDLYDFNLIFTPGVIRNLHSTTVDRMIDMCETRGDVLYIYDDNSLTDSIATAINQVNASGINSSYAATYYPWVKINDATNNKQLWVPASVALPGVFSYSDKVGYEWFAPAGFNRGSMVDVLDTYIPVSKPNRDLLYAAKINAIGKFPAEGIVCLGQKTMQTRESALDRINVRRLMIKVKKYIASASKYLLFEPNTDRTRTEFLNIVNPYLDNIKTKQGLYLFKVVCDESNNTSDIIDRNILYAQIWLQPTKSSEFIIIDFNVTNTGANFDTI